MSFKKRVEKDRLYKAHLAIESMIGNPRIEERTKKILYSLERQIIEKQFFTSRQFVLLGRIKKQLEQAKAKQP